MKMFFLSSSPWRQLALIAAVNACPVGGAKLIDGILRQGAAAPWSMGDAVVEGSELVLTTW